MTVKLLSVWQARLAIPSTPLSLPKSSSLRGRHLDTDSMAEAQSDPLEPDPEALGCAGDRDERAVDPGILHVDVFRSGVDKSCEDLAVDPVPEAWEDGVPVPEDRRHTAPRRGSATGSPP